MSHVIKGWSQVELKGRYTTYIFQPPNLNTRNLSQTNIHPTSIPFWNMSNQPIFCPICNDSKVSNLWFSKQLSVFLLVSRVLLEYYTDLCISFILMCYFFSSPRLFTCYFVVWRSCFNIKTVLRFVHKTKETFVTPFQKMHSIQQMHLTNNIYKVY